MSVWDGGEIALTHEVYDCAAITEAAEGYKDHLIVNVVSQTVDESVVDFALPVGGRRPSEELVHDFLNYLLDLSVRVRLSTTS